MYFLLVIGDIMRDKRLFDELFHCFAESRIVRMQLTVYHIIERLKKTLVVETCTAIIINH